MLEILIHTLIHSLKDSIKLIPFLFIAFLIIELIEHRFSKKTKKFIEKSGKFGPIIGSLLGIVPQCGFSVVATNFYITRVISLGTLFSVYLSTSDEMLPILISSNVDIKTILLILLIKVVSGMVFGFLIDFIFINKNKKISLNYNFCDEEHCDCNHSLFKSSLIHTLNTLLFILGVSFLLNILFEYASDSLINRIFMKDNIFGPFVGSLIGLIPNCGASVALTELFLNGAINLGTCIAGLLTGSGVAILVLFKTNKNLKENLIILTTLYFIGVLVGIIIEVLLFLI